MAVTGRAPFHFGVEVRWGDMDALGHVNNTVFFRYLESARIAWFDAQGMARWAGSASEGPGLVRTDLNFRRQVRYPARLQVETSVTRIGDRSFDHVYRIVDLAAGEVCADGSATMVWVDYALGRAVPLPSPLRAALEAALDQGAG